jgi:hypothetical protein
MMDGLKLMISDIESANWSSYSKEAKTKILQDRAEGVVQAAGSGLIQPGYLMETDGEDTAEYWRHMRAKGKTAKEAKG